MTGHHQQIGPAPSPIITHPIKIDRHPSQYIDHHLFPLILIIIDMQGEEHQEPLTVTEPQTASPAEQLRSALHLAKTMPPSKIRKNLVGLTNLAPQIEDILLQKVDLPIQIESTDPSHPFLKTEFNRDGDSYRSPHSNTYFPESQGGYVPSGEFRKIQQLGNILFAEYTKLYYGGQALGSFYVIENEDPHKFSCGFFAKKNLAENEGFGGSWDSFNVIDIDTRQEEAVFTIATTIMIEMVIKNQKQGDIDMTGFLKQTKTQKRRLNKERLEECLVVVGELVQDLQTVMRQNLDAVYVSKTKEIIFSTRHEYTVEYQNQRRSLAQGLKQIHLGNNN